MSSKPELYPTASCLKSGSEPTGAGGLSLSLASNLPILTALVLPLLLAGCAGIAARNDMETAAKAPPAPPVVVAVPQAKPLPAPPSQPSPQQNQGEQTLRMLAYGERVRMMAQPELNQEIARLADTRLPTEQLQLAMALSQLRQLPELIRAQELLARVLGNAEADALHPLARLLASRYIEQRRAEEQLERQNQQVRDIQRRLDQTNERLEALKAIERSLSNRQPAPPPPVAAPPQSAPAPANGTARARPAP